MTLPELLDNLEDETRHGQALVFLIDDLDAKHPLAVATGYVNLEGLHHLAEILDGRPVRLMLGAAPDPGLGAAPPPIDRFQLQLAALSDERNFSRFPPSRAAERLTAVEEWLARPEVEVRRFTREFLHGKAYLFGDAGDPRVALVTSANLTGAGLSRNLELGLTHYQPHVVGQAIEWFDRLWEEATDFGDDLNALLFPDPGRVDPRTVYLRALLELQPPEPDDPSRASRPTGLDLAPFQRDGYERARVIARQHGGVIYADGVGTGKTEIGLAFVEERTEEDGAYALIVTPAQLKKRWQDRIHQEKLPAQVISFQELASDEQLAPDARRPQRHLSNRKDTYRLVLVDEAHALRNEDTSWYRAMERLLGGKPKQVVLLTATPINNGLWDLYNMVMLFARHDRAFSAIGLDSVRNLFIEAGANERDPENLSPDVLYPLADAVSVRRDRVFIERTYQGATFPDGTPVRFPKPSLRTHRYDLDAAHPGLFGSIADEIDALTMARYRPSAFDLSSEEENAEAQLAGLLKSGLLKRFESCWRACLATVERMLGAHDAFLFAWERGEVLSREELRAAAAEDVDEAGLASWLDERLEGDGRRGSEDFSPEFGPAVAADRERLGAIRDELLQLGEGEDPKLELLAELLEDSPAKKIAVFSTFGATVRYLAENLPERIGGRERVVVIGGETTPDERTAALSRFAPETVVEAGYQPPDGEVDLLLSTDVLSEGQNLQQAQAVISYDMPWNPQRVVQRNGRVIRLRSPHREVFLTTMLPKPGELERLLGLEARIQAKIKAASGVYGMESEVIEGIEAEIEAELRNFAERLAAGDPDLAKEAEEDSGAFVGEELRRLIDRALVEGEVERVLRLPWGIGACFRQSAAGRSRGAPGVFFATRTPRMADAEGGYRYWRYVEFESDALIDGDLEILRRIDPQDGDPAEPDGIDLDGAWEKAAASIVEQHNKRADLRASQEQIGPRQRWALEILRDPSVSLAVASEVVDAADAALSVERSSAVRRALREVQEQLDDSQISRDAAATGVVKVVEDFGLRPIEPPPLPGKVTTEDLGVVCWMAVLPAQS
ncbi:MAG TPA: helicase-related protein [Solirubrobacterales bacterium]